ncbi:zinc-binding dehydrogenase [Rhodobacterales bacterium HKCCSP123]|nr:zinc-binding dehydrogenase [Rhodobacterales bacterium HKCCSP123]
MRAFQVTEFGAAPRHVDLPEPEPGPGQIRVRIAACGLNFADLLMIRGTYQETPPPPFTLGMEVSGTVDALGEGVTSPAVGTRVAVFAGHGGLAEQGVFPADRAVPIPDAMSFTQAAAFMVAYGTSHLALAGRARLQPGERLLVLGAAGGVGLTAVELGALMGAEVIAVARGPEKLAVAERAGARHLIDSESADIRAGVKALGGADVVYDAVGGGAFDAALRATRPEGRVLSIGFASGEVPRVPANILLVKNISVMGFYWGGYLGFAPEKLTASLADLMALFEAGRLSPHVSATFPLAEAGQALEMLRSRKSTGKVVVTI